MIETVLFDLDGTLTEPDEGILNSVIYALDKFSIKVEDRRELYCFIGPPLVDSFKGVFCFSEEQAVLAVKYYREYFSEKGIFENRLYDGVKEMLLNLKKSGKKIVLATSKPEEFAIKILKFFQIYEFFDYVCGATMDETRNDKVDVIAYIVENYEFDIKKAVMVGDRKYDITGAHENGIKAIGVLYGYGERQELLDAKADILADSVNSLNNILLSF